MVVRYTKYVLNVKKIHHRKLYIQGTEGNWEHIICEIALCSS